MIINETTLGEKERKSDFLAFCKNVHQLREEKGIRDLSHYDLRHYCQTVINTASVLQTIACMECNDRVDLMVDEGESLDTGIQEKLQQFVKSRLGLDCRFQGDPRGPVVRIVGNNREYGVPAYESNVYFV